DIKEDENEPELAYPYEEVDPFNPLPHASKSEPEDVIEVEDSVEPKDETVPASVHEVGESSTVPFLQEDSDGLLPGFIRREIYSLFGRMTSLSRRTMEEGTAAMEDRVRKLGNAEEKAECKKLKKEHTSSVFVFEERLNEAIDVPVEDEKNQSSEQRGSPQSVDAAITAKRARHANVGNDARGFGPVRGQDAALVICECTFSGFMKCNLTVFRGTKGAVELQRWFEKTESFFRISEWVEGKKVKFAATTLQGPDLTWWNSKVATMGLETVNQMP
ncbi:hypothetical protein Tco_0916895, partial [Tanacetum coccineum]